MKKKKATKKQLKEKLKINAGFNEALTVLVSDKKKKP